ncbi:MAG TPA: MlaD family protein [Nocardia sp.]|uniref:MlaD family protein n=1 Tax=Nocardia TaxID=1817 RepID=UPI002454B9CD|nr:MULTISPECIES: MlaD family protein [Nocardia]HLS76741.1 MlaD family protein [Nocardia sp.]
MTDHAQTPRPRNTSAAGSAVRRAARSLLATVTAPVERHDPLRLGAVAVALLTVLVLGVVGISRIGFGKVTYEAEFAQAAQLTPGDQVSTAGVPIGTVESLRLDGDRVLVRMSIDRDVDLGAQTRASIKLTTLLGSRYVDIAPAGEGSVPDRRIRLSHTSVPYDLQTALQNATTTFEQVDADRIADSMAVLADQLQGAPALVPDMLRNIENLSGVIADRRDQLGTLLASTEELTTAIRDQQLTLGRMVNQGAVLVGELNTRIEALGRLIDASSTLIQRLDEMLGEQQSQIVRLLTDLERLVGALSARQDVLRSTLEILPVPVRNFTNALGSANALDFNAPAGTLIDSWMCAVGNQARSMTLAEYFKDCR